MLFYEAHLFSLIEMQPECRLNLRALYHHQYAKSAGYSLFLFASSPRPPMPSLRGVLVQLSLSQKRKKTQTALCPEISKFAVMNL